MQCLKRKKSPGSVGNAGGKIKKVGFFKVPLSKNWAKMRTFYQEDLSGRFLQQLKIQSISARFLF